MARPRKRPSSDGRWPGPAHRPELGAGGGGRKRTSSGLDGLLIGVEDVDAVDVERNIGCARLGRAIHGARGSGRKRASSGWVPRFAVSPRPASRSQGAGRLYICLEFLL